jgi:hypothetical protein
MDFSDFTAVTLAGPGQGGGGRAAFADSRANWTWAAGNVAVWNFIITVGLAVPAAAFLEAFHHQPVRETDGTWVWSYNVEVAHALHLAELHGKATDDGIQWAMHVSKEDAYSDFIWYTGESNVGGTEGTWIVNYSPDNSYPLLGILWHRNPEEATADIRYTNIVPGGAENGGYIYYGIRDNLPLDAFYDIYNKSQDNLITIQWSLEAANGRVSDPIHFGDAGWHCWDENLDDTTCE